jgi:integrase
LKENEMPKIKSKLLTKQAIHDFMQGSLFGSSLHDGHNLYLYKNKYSYVWKFKTQHKVGNKTHYSWKVIGDARDVTLTQARTRADEMRSLIRQNINIHTHRKEQTLLGKKFGEIVDIYINACKRSIKPQSKAKLIAVLNKAAILNKQIISKITETDIDNIIKRVKLKSPSTAATLLREIRLIFKFAYDEKYLIHKLDINVKAKYKVNVRSRYLDEKKLGELFKKLWNDNNVPITIKTAIYTLFITMLRREELLSLEWSEVDLDNAKITVKSAKWIDNFIIRIPQQLVSRLQQLRQKYPAVKYVFNCREDRYNGDTLCRYCKQLGEKYGIGEFTPHDARRTAMTLLADNNHNYKVIDMALGHIQQGVNKAYIKTHLSEPRAKLLQDWADLIDKLTV